jgi:hypothetical protein
MDRLEPKRRRGYGRVAGISPRDQPEEQTMGYEEAKADIKKTMREADNNAKEMWRRADGDESLSDKAANTADDIRAGLGNAGDDLRVESERIREEADREAQKDKV